jgi:hypothetical protein
VCWGSSVFCGFVWCLELRGGSRKQEGYPKVRRCQLLRGLGLRMAGLVEPCMPRPPAVAARAGGGAGKARRGSCRKRV